LRFFAERTLKKEPAIVSYSVAADLLQSWAEAINASGPHAFDWRKDIKFKEIDERWVTRNLSDLKKKTLASAGPEFVALSHRLPERGHCALRLEAKLIRIGE
jgi:hypothetical protein